MVIPTINSLISHDCFSQKLSFSEYNHSPANKHKYFSDKLSAELDVVISHFYPSLIKHINRVQNNILKKDLLFSLKEFVFFSNYCLEQTSFPLYVVEICSRHYSKLISNGILFGLTHKDVLLYNQHNITPEPISFSLSDMLDFYKQSYLLNIKTNNSISHVVVAIEEHTRLLVFYQLAKDNMTTETLPDNDLRLYEGEHRCSFCLEIYKDSTNGSLTRRHKTKLKKSKFIEVNSVLNLSVYCLGSGRENTENGVEVIQEAIDIYERQIASLKTLIECAQLDEIKLKKECNGYINKLKKLVIELKKHKYYNFSI